ncbi:ribonuclease E activity regulator RraA [Streptomyces spongiae]|uniref:4-hydroxy-4-methyl-2-oxoglutarate aldolase n=1 Tax=Streptomyces spongiae TaxID=565072 RepID=A0A5N8XA01_9ACTN|nr:ribonuclease E activity regulator RraA [Streptomyces spongiae]MPY55718.1 ribonuclease E activity regulator RraA [Streptomyces spongiae]
MTERPVSTAEFYDEYGDRLLVCDLQFAQYGGRRAFQGSIVTVLSYEDNVLLKQVVAEPGDGRVIVVDTQGSLRVAMLGDNMARKAAENGWAGIVVNGAVRDAVALRGLPIGVKALGTNPRRSLKQGTGDLNVPVAFGGVAFHPGATLVSDGDGIVVLPGQP